MHQITEEIIMSKEWRSSELETLKKIGKVTLNNSSERIHKQYYRMCIPYIYAHWEGFIVESLKQIVNFINNEELDKPKIINELFALSVIDEIRSLSGKQNFKQVSQFTDKFSKSYLNKLYIKQTLVSAKSNLNYEQFSILLSKFGINNCFDQYKSDINFLVNIRNQIAHGENGVDISYDMLEKEIALVQKIFDMFIIECDKYLLNKKYLKEFC